MYQQWYEGERGLSDVEDKAPESGPGTLERQTFAGGTSDVVGADVATHCIGSEPCKRLGGKHLGWVGFASGRWSGRQSVVGSIWPAFEDLADRLLQRLQTFEGCWLWVWPKVAQAAMQQQQECCSLALVVWLLATTSPAAFRDWRRRRPTSV